MLEPLLDRLEVIIGVDSYPTVTHITQHSFGIEFSNVRILGEQGIAFLQGVDVFTVARRVSVIETQMREN